MNALMQIDTVLTVAATAAALAWLTVKVLSDG